jgi:hypothetical protein
MIRNHTFNKTGVERCASSPGVVFASKKSSILVFFPPGLFFKNLCSGDGVAVNKGAAIDEGGESVKFNLFLGLVRVGSRSLAIPFGLANLEMEIDLGFAIPRRTFVIVIVSVRNCAQIVISGNLKRVSTSIKRWIRPFIWHIYVMHFILS